MCFLVVCIVFFWKKEFGVNAARNMLENLTTGRSSFFFPFFSFCNRNKFRRKNLNHVQQDSRQGSKLLRSTRDMGWSCRFVALTKLLRKTGVLYFCGSLSPKMLPISHSEILVVIGQST